MASGDVVYRPLVVDDWEQWQPLWRGYLEFYKSELPPEVYKSSFERMVSGAEHEFRGIVAEKNGKLIGLAHYLFHRNGWKIENVCYLQDLFVDPSERGTGAGRGLIEAVYAKADEAGAPQVYWNTQEFNTTARQLYDRVGHVTPFIKYNRFNK